MLLKTNKEIIFYIILGFIIVGLIILTFFPGIINAIKDSGKIGEDLCAHDPGYTEEAWKEHMGYHPDIYKDCL